MILAERCKDLRKTTAYMVFSRVLAAACVLAGSVVAMDLSELQRLDSEFADFEHSLEKSASKLALANQPEAPKLGLPKFSSNELAIFARKVRKGWVW
jgi:hypothetical protein